MGPGLCLWGRDFTCGSSLPFHLHGLMLLQGGTQKQHNNVEGKAGEGMHSSAQCLPETLQNKPTSSALPWFTYPS